MNIVIDYFLRWLVGWAMIFDGIVYVLSLGFVRPNLTMVLAKAKSKWHYYRVLDKNY